MRDYYPNAITTIDSVNKLIDFIDDELDIDPSSVMLADSICSDDIKSIPYPPRAMELLALFRVG
ncbi:MAG: hypothetical protein ACJA0X_001159 [Cyclobacteriaceae bacterium]|jgi:hypothetical protein